MVKHTHPHLHVSRAIVALLIGVVAIPTAMTGLFQSIDDDGINKVHVEDLRDRALANAATVRQERRDFWRAVAIYKELVRIGIEDLTPPDINDRESVAFYLDYSEADEQSLHSSAQEFNDAQAQYNALSERYRDLLDGYLFTGACPGSLRQFHLAGFYDLCNSLLDERIASLQLHQLDRSAYLRGFQPVGYAPLRNLRSRLENLQQSLLYEGGTSVRPRTHSGYRPRLDYSEYHSE